MADAEEEGATREEQQVSSSSSGPADSQPAAGRTEDAEERPAEGEAAVSRCGELSMESYLEQFKVRKYFVLRPGTLNQAIKDVEALVNMEVDGSFRSVWLMAEVDHWNNEKERLVLITDNSLLVIKYDFVMFRCEQIQRIQLNFMDRIAHGTFSFPKHSLLQREGEGVRVFWDRLREPSFISRWNPFATDFPFITFVYHPVRNISDTLSALCDGAELQKKVAAPTHYHITQPWMQIQNFREKLKEAAQKVHTMKPVPGKANGVLVLNQQIHIDAYVGAMSFLGNQNKLGYSFARGNIGF